MAAAVLCLAAMTAVAIPPAPAATGNIAPAEARSPARGYWLAAADGGIFAFGAARFLGAAAEANLTFAAMGATPSGHGYWLASRDGRTYAFGDALDLGSVPRVRSPIVGIAPTPSGSGAWLVGSDGGIFSFGDARFHGSTGNIDLNQPIVTGAAAVETALSTGSVAY